MPEYYAPLNPLPLFSSPARAKSGESVMQRVFCLLFPRWLYMYADSELTVPRSRIRLVKVHRLDTRSVQANAPTKYYFEAADDETTTLLCAEHAAQLTEWVNEMKRFVREAQEEAKDDNRKLGVSRACLPCLVVPTVAAHMMHTLL